MHADGGHRTVKQGADARLFGPTAGRRVGDSGTDSRQAACDGELSILPREGSAEPRARHVATFLPQFGQTVGLSRTSRLYLSKSVGSSVASNSVSSAPSSSGSSVDEIAADLTLGRPAFESLERNCTKIDFNSSGTSVG